MEDRKSGKSLVTGYQDIKNQISKMADKTVELKRYL